MHLFLGIDFLTMIASIAMQNMYTKTDVATNGGWDKKLFCALAVDPNRVITKLRTQTAPTKRINKQFLQTFLFYSSLDSELELPLQSERHNISFIL